MANTTRSTPRLGRHVYGFGVMALGLVGLAWGDFIPGQPVPKAFPAHTGLAYLAATFLLVAGLTIMWRRTAGKAAAALAAYFGLVVVVLMNGRIVYAHYREYGTYSGLAEQVSIMAGALIVHAAYAPLATASRPRLVQIGQVAFAVCALLFGGAHFVYLNLTAPLVPRWLPPSPKFWAWATGVGFLAAGAAILTRFQARLAAVLLTAMLASFFLLVHLPMLLAAPASRANWSEAATNLVITGAAWIVADSFGGSEQTA